MIYGSVCSGVEAATLAWEPLGLEPAFFAEVEPFPSAVLMNRLGATKPIRPLDPEETDDKKEKKMRSAWKKAIAKFPETGTIPNYGDFTKIKKEDLHGKQIDLLVGGCPCQDFSVAGKRMGLDGHRGGLSLEFIRLAYELGTRWVLFENVPGLLSQDHGRAFGSFLSGLSGCVVTPPRDGWSTAGLVRNTRKDRFGLAWRILDAQFTRVPGFTYAIPQRRRRLFVVGYFGDWTSAAEVLFERKMLRWDPPPRRTKGQGFASCAERSIDSAKSIRMRGGRPGGGKGALIGDNLSHTLATGNDQTIITFPRDPSVWTIDADRSNSMKSGNPKQFRASQYGEFVETETAGTLKPNQSSIKSSATLNIEQKQDVICKDGMCRNQAGMAVVEVDKPDKLNKQDRQDISTTIRKGGTTSADGGAVVPAVYSIGNGQVCEANAMQKEVCQTLNCMHETQAILVNEKKAETQYGNIAGTLEARHDSSPCADRGQNIVCVHGSQHQIWNSDHANAVNRNNGLENVIAYENHPNDSRVTELKDGVFPNINAKAGMGGGNLPLVQDCKSIAIAENVIGREVETGGGGVGAQEELAYTQNATGVMGVSCNATVRRLMPIECERLMGFPDNWTRIPWNGKPEEECPDAPRYKACGNSMCVNVMRWIGMRIHKVEEMREER